ncbi:MAG: AAA family ATPase [Thermoguttaceae bacterium]
MKRKPELLDAPPPNAVESERALLAGFLDRGQLDLDCDLQVLQFYDPRNGAIYSAMNDLTGEAGGFDSTALIAKLRAHPLWGRDGFDAAFVAEVLTARGNPAIGPFHSRQIKEAWKRRQVGDEALNLLQLSRNGSFSLERLRQSLDAIRTVCGEGDAGGKGQTDTSAKPARPLPALAPGTRVYAGDRGNIGEIVEDHGARCLLHFRSPEGVEADVDLPRSQLRSLDGQPLDGEPAEPLPPPVSLQELVTKYPKQRAPVIEGLLRSGETMNIVAAPKKGKSWLLYALLLCVVAGIRWLGTFRCIPGRVLLLDNELHPEVIAHRLPMVADAMGLSREYLAFIDVVPVRGLGIDLLKLKSFIESIEPGRYALVAADAFYRLLPLGFSENDNAQVMSLYNTIDTYAAHLGAAWVNIHHASKGDQSGKSATDVGAGAGSQSRAADTHLIIRQHEEEDVAVIEGAVRSWPPVERLAIRWTFPTWQLDTEADPRKLWTARNTRDRQSREDKDVHLDEDRQVIVNAMVATPGPQTKTFIRDSTRIGNPRFGFAWASLLTDGTITGVGKIKKGNGQSYDSFILSRQEPEQ